MVWSLMFPASLARAKMQESSLVRSLGNAIWLICPSIYPSKSACILAMGRHFERMLCSAAMAGHHKMAAARSDR